MSVTMDDMVRRFAEYVGISQTRAKEQWSDVCKFITDSLKQGNEVTILGTGTFNFVKKNERAYRNPRTGESILSPAHYAPHMSFIPSLKDTIKSNMVVSE